MRSLAMFIIAVCFIFLLKLSWPKNKSFMEKMFYIISFFRKTLFYGFDNHGGSYFILFTIACHLCKSRQTARQTDMEIYKRIYDKLDLSDLLEVNVHGYMRTLGV